MNTVRIEVPANPTDGLTLAGKIMAKHVELGVKSPLNGLEWTVNGKNITDATGFDNQAADLSKATEKAYGDRDSLMPAVTEFVRSCRDVLTGVYRSNPRALGDFGFEVNDAVSKTVKKNGNNVTPAH